MKKTVFFGLLVILLAFGFIGCDGGGSTDNENYQLPEPVGINELDGKTFDNGSLIISFAEDNSYTLSEKWEHKGNEEIEIKEMGFYSWNTPEKTVVLGLDKTDEEFGLQNKSELKESYIEYLSSLPTEEQRLPPGTTIEQYVDMMVEVLFSPAVYDYEIGGGLITYFGIRVALPDTGTTIADCAYSQKAASKGFGTHYLLDISFDDALAILTPAYGQPLDGWGLFTNSAITSGTDWVILEFTRFNDFRLTKSESGETTTKAWPLYLP